MWRLAHVPLLAVLLVSPAWADPPKAVIVGPAKPVASGGIVLLDGTQSVSEPGLALRWVVTPPVPFVAMTPVGDNRPGAYALLPAPPDGTYRVKLIVKGKPDSAKPDLDADADVFDFTVGGAAPPTPVPPAPAPPAPKPESDFAASIQTAYTAEAGLNKATHTAALARLYDAAASVTVNDPTVKTYGDLFGDLKAASPGLLPADAIPLVRKAIAARLNQSLSQPNQPIDRTYAAAELSAVAAALKGVK